MGIILLCGTSVNCLGGKEAFYFRESHEQRKTPINGLTPKAAGWTSH